MGRVFEHHWGRTILRAESVLFATQALQHNPLYFNVEYARALGHPDVVVPPPLVYLTVLGLSVEDLSEIGGPFLGAEAIRFPRPVYPDATLYAVSRVIDRRPSTSRPAYGVVTWQTLGITAPGEVVVELIRRNLVQRKGESS